MKKSKGFDNILNDCLDRLMVKGETIEQCLASYPKQADELKSLLQIAIATKKASAIQARPEFRAKARYQFHSALQEMEGKRGRPFFGWLPRWATVVTIVLVFLLAGGGTVAAAGSSMPDNPLYPVKLATEQVRLTLTPSDIAKARLCARLADRRVAEIVYMANEGSPQQVEAITQRLDKHLVMLTRLVSLQKEGGAPKALAPAPEETRGSQGVSVGGNNRAKLKKTVAHYAAHHSAALRTVLKTAPGGVKPALLKAIAISEADYEKALEALD